jgi:diguanylate cyclase (GGDEF)-like protein
VADAEPFRQGEPLVPYDAAAFDDRARVAALRRYGLLSDPDLGDLDALARVAKTVCGTETAALNLIDEKTSSIPCYPGVFPMEIPRELTLCEPTIREGVLIYSEDINTDPRWEGHPVVNVETPILRTHASAPLITPDGHSIGTLCVSDPERVPMTPPQLEALQDLADAAMALIESRVSDARLRAAIGELAVCATHDSLTGVANREQLFDFLGELAERQMGHAVLFLDLDKFKAVNDEHGHAIGDRVLEATGARLRSVCREGDLVARLGGDEFVVVVCDDRETVIASVAQRVRDLIEVEILTTVGEMRVGVSVGWAQAIEGETPSELIERADRAMYAVKQVRAR